MANIHEMLKDIPAPRMVRVHQIFDDSCSKDVPVKVRKELQRPEVAAKIKPDMRIAATAGSRGINNLTIIMREV